jgi:cytochrome c peroxidase
MKRAVSAILSLVALLAMAFSQSEQRLVQPEGWPKPAAAYARLKLSNDARHLGRKLFYDPILSADSTISCASCHLSYTGFAHTDHALSHGINGKTGIRNAPAIFNLGWSRELMWDGASAGVFEFASRPITNPLEMNETMPHVLEKVRQVHDYRLWFAMVYGDTAITGQRLMNVLGQFLLSIQSYNALYDRVMRHEDTFNSYQARGYQVYKQHCAGCHTEPLFTNNGFENNGLPADTSLNDVGRYKVTGKTRDMYRFKVPSLRNVEVTYPYMHDGRFRNLQMVLLHYTTGIQQDKYLSPQLRKKIVLSTEEKQDLLAFLRALTDETFLKNRAYNDPMHNQP